MCTYLAMVSYAISMPLTMVSTVELSRMVGSVLKMCSATWILPFFEAKNWWNHENSPDSPLEMPFKSRFQACSEQLNCLKAMRSLEKSKLSASRRFAKAQAMCEVLGTWFIYTYAFCAL